MTYHPFMARAPVVSLVPRWIDRDARRIARRLNLRLAEVLRIELARANDNRGDVWR